MHPQLQAALERAEQNERVRAMAAQLRGLLAGTRTRDEVASWARELAAVAPPQLTPFRNPTAACVFMGLSEIRDDEWIRPADLRAWLRWLEEGETFVADTEPLFSVNMALDEIAQRTDAAAIRQIIDGLGWYEILSFCAPASGRPIIASARRGFPGRVLVYKQRTDAWRDAVIDIFETLAIDERDTLDLHPTIDLEQLPQWSLWRADDFGNHVEIDRYHCYAKASALEQMFAARGHKQSYWVDPTVI